MRKNCLLFGALAVDKIILKIILKKEGVTMKLQGKKIIVTGGASGLQQ